MEPDGRVGARFDLGAPPDPVAFARVERVVALVDRLRNGEEEEDEEDDDDEKTSDEKKTAVRDDDDVIDDDVIDATTIRRAALALRRAMDAFSDAEASRRAGGGGADDDVVVSDFLPEDWPAKADALFVLAALVEIGLAPPEASPPEAARDPRGWARVAIETSAEMGSAESRLSMADRALRDRDESESSDESSAADRCAAAMAWLRPAADDAVADAEASGEFHLPRAPPRLRDRDRDAGWTMDAEAEDGWAQVAMEEDLAARGVPEAQRHVGYRRLVGRGMARDEIAAARAFADAADAGTPPPRSISGTCTCGAWASRWITPRAGQLSDAPPTRTSPRRITASACCIITDGEPRGRRRRADAFAAGAARGPGRVVQSRRVTPVGRGRGEKSHARVRTVPGGERGGALARAARAGVGDLDGAGTTRDCTEAARLFWTFLEERLGWAETQERAVLVLDGTGDTGETGEIGDGDGMREKDASEDSANPTGRRRRGRGGRIRARTPSPAGSLERVGDVRGVGGVGVGERGE